MSKGTDYLIDIVGLAEDTKPNENIKDGSTFYTVDTQELYVFYAGEWYKQGEETEPEETELTENTEGGDQR